MKSFNQVSLKGRLHSYELSMKEEDAAIYGSIFVEVNAEGAIVEVRYYVTPKTKKNEVNKSYDFLEKVMDGEVKTIKDDGDEASWVTVSAKISPDFFVPRDGAKTIDDLAVSQKVRGFAIRGGKSNEYENMWNCDMLITRIEEIEPDEEKHISHKVKVSGYIVDEYNKRLMPMRCDAIDNDAINYSLTLEASPELPIYSSVKGEFRKEVTSIVKESAFGEDEVIEYDNIRWAMRWMPRIPYDFGDDISEDEYKDFLDGLTEYKTEKLEKNREKQEASEKDKLVF